MLRFIQDDVLSQASPDYQVDPNLTVRALPERIAGRFEQATGPPPLVEASIRQTLGSVPAVLRQPQATYWSIFDARGRTNFFVSGSGWDDRPNQTFQVDRRPPPR